MNFRKIQDVQTDDFGNKAINLCKLTSLGISVPDGICLDYGYFEAYVAKNESYKPKIREIVSYVGQFLDSKDGWVVRSSSEIEDSDDYSSAGVFKSVHIESINLLEQAIEEVLNSSFNSMQPNVRMAVIIQKFIQPEYSGVSFSCHPLNGGSKPVIEFVRGHCSWLVEGLVLPNTIDFNEQIPIETFTEFPFLKEIASLTNKLSINFSEELDLEWIVKGTNIYWVQMRPVVSKSMQSINEIDVACLTPGRWELLDRARMPLTPIEKSMDPTGTLNFPQWDSKIVNGYHYVRFRQHDQSKEQIDKNYIKNWEKIAKKFTVHLEKKADIKELDNTALLNHLTEMIKVSRDLYRFYMNREWFRDRKKLQTSLNEDIHRIAASTTQANELFADVSSAIKSKTYEKRNRLHDLIKKSRNGEVLIPNTFEEVIQNKNAWSSEFWSYIEEFGDSCPTTLSLYTKSLRENASFLYWQIKHWINDTYYIENKEKEDSWINALSIIRKKMDKSSFEKFLPKIILYREYLKITENDDYLLEKNISRLKEVLFELANRLELDEPEDIFFLHKEELIDQLTFATENKCKYDMTKFIELRKKEFNLMWKTKMPPTVIDGEYEPEETIDDLITDIIKGQSASSGISVGRAYVLKDICKIDDFLDIKPDDIVITSFLTPGVTQNLIFCSGIITEIGSFLSHGAIFAREIGLPAIVGVDGATERIKHGQKIKMDAMAGVIYILE